MPCPCRWSDQPHDGFATEPADADDLAAIAKGYAVELPEDYLAFMAAHDGGEITGDDITVGIFPAAELRADLPLFKRLRKDGKAPQLVVFGGDKDGELLVLDYRTEPPLIRMTPVATFGYDDAMPIAASFDALIRRHGHLGPV